MQIKNPTRLIISLALPQTAGLIGSIFTTSSVSTWYATLQKPSFSPPSWLFGPVWVLLYLLMGISIYLIWQKHSPKNILAKLSAKVTAKPKNRGVLWLFWLHLIFNASWSISFFGLKNPGLGLINIIIIWLFVIVIMIKFYSLNKISTYLLIPYFLWTTFALILNYSLWQLN